MLKDFEDDYEVCSCMGISLKEIVDAIKEHNLTTVEGIMDKTEAGTACEQCQSAKKSEGNKEIHLDEILKEVIG